MLGGEWSILLVLELYFLYLGVIIDWYFVPVNYFAYVQYSLVYGYSSESRCGADCIRMKRPLWEEKKVVMMEME